MGNATLVNKSIDKHKNIIIYYTNKACCMPTILKDLQLTQSVWIVKIHTMACTDKLRKLKNLYTKLY